jgi:hypothetical protein
MSGEISSGTAVSITTTIGFFATAATCVSNAACESLREMLSASLPSEASPKVVPDAHRITHECTSAHPGSYFMLLLLKACLALCMHAPMATTHVSAAWQSATEALRVLAVVVLLAYFATASTTFQYFPPQTLWGP